MTHRKTTHLAVRLERSMPPQTNRCSFAAVCTPNPPQSPILQRARAMMLGSTGPMVGFYGLVVVSVSLTLSKAIRDSERSAALQMSSHSSKKGSAVATPASSYNIKRWAMACVRRDFGTGGGNGGDGADAGSGGNRGAAGNHTGNRPKANGGYAKTKSLLTKLTRASVAVMSAVMVVIVLSLHEGTIAHVS